MDFTTCLLREFTFLMLISLCYARAQHRGSSSFRGRHVCSQHKQISQPAPVNQSYRRAVYRHDLQRMTYQTAYRTVIHIRLSSKLVSTCCPGWAKRSQRDTSCLKAICNDTCGHGRCIRPGLCVCTGGYTGYKCETDINECKGRNRCTQKCVNTEGSYECDCQEGFKLSEDRITCLLCLTCTKEYQDIQQRLQNMSARIENLADEKKVLQTNLTSAVTQYKEAIQALHRVEVTSSNPSTTSDPNFEPYMKHMPLDRLASLSQQISILEERMASCMCGLDYNMLG